MKRNIILSVALLFAAIALQAAPITSKQAAKNAQTFLYGKSNMKFSTAPIKMVTSDSGIQPYYVFNIGDNGGYVIVAGDDAAYPIFGYSRKGHFDVNNMPDNMKMWLDAYAADMKKIQKMNLPAYKEPETRAEEWAAIPQLLTSQWNQMYPYNNMCPKFEGDPDYRPTGCVATAMAQVMYYHKWPVDATTSIPGYSYNDEPAWGGDGTKKTIEAIEPTVFNWDAMRDVYDYYSEKESEDAVAELMMYAGHSVQMMYGVEASGAYSENIVTALKKYFGYKNTAKIIYRDLFKTQDEWNAIMYNELVENRPILYSGVTKDNAGHQFVCDGYEDGFFHINWGWGGMSDGFFKLEILDPYNQGTGGAGTGMAFSEMQSAVIGVDKPVEDDRMYVKDIKILPGEGKSLNIALNNSRKNYTSMQFDLKLPEGFEISDINLDLSRSENGDHKLSVGKISDGSYRFIVHSPTNSKFTGSDGAVINATLNAPENAELGSYKAEICNVLMCDVKLNGFKLNDCEFAINVISDSLLMGDADDNGIVDNNDVNSIVLSILNGNSDDVNLDLADFDADGTLDIEDVMLTADVILQNTGTERHIVATETNYDDAISLTPYYDDLLIYLKNSTMYKALQMDITLPEGITITEMLSSDIRTKNYECLYSKVSNRKFRVLIFVRDGRNIEGDNGMIAQFTTDKLVENANITDIIMVTSDLRKMQLKDVEYKLPTGIDNVTVEDVDNADVYTIEGVRVDSSAAKLQKGVYIVNGKKLIVR